MTVVEAYASTVKQLELEDAIGRQWWVTLDGEHYYVLSEHQVDGSAWRRYVLVRKDAIERIPHTFD